jgi:hypothetical protein
MAIVGDAYINIHADTSRVRQQIRNSMAGVDKEFENAGRSSGEKFNRGFSRGGSRGQIFSKRFEADIDRARTKLANLIAVGNFLGPALTGLVGAVGALGGGLFTLAAAAGQAGPALIVLPGIFASVAQAAITLKLAFSGVGAALSAGLRGGGGGGGAQKAKRDLTQLKNALEGVAEARRKLTQVVRDNAVRRLEAMEAARDAQERIDDAVFAAASAERSYQQAILNTKDAQDRLSQARKEAIEDLQQLRFESEGAAIGEKRARLQFDKAREALRRVQDLPPNNRARQEAELAFAEADLNLRRAIDKNNDLRKEEQEATKAGVDGSKKVIDAQKGLRDAKFSEESALRDVIAAQKDVVKARMDAARAARNVGLVEQENAQRQQEAVDALKKALAGVADARKKAFAPSGGGGGGGANAFADAMSKLSKEAQDFVRYLLSIQDEFKKLKAAAGEELFPRLTVAIDNLVKNLFPALIPLLRGTGGAIGDVAIRLSQTITEADNLRRLENIWKTGDVLLRIFGEAVANLYTVFLTLLQAADPLLRRFAVWTYNVTNAWKASAILGEQTGSLTAMFNRAGDVAAQLGRIFGNVFGGLRQMFQAAVGPGSGGQFLLDFFEQATAKFESFRAVGNKSGNLKEYFLNASVNASLILTLLNQIFQAILRVGSGPEVGQFAGLLTQVVGIVEEIMINFNSALPLLGKLAVEVAKTLEVFSDSGALEMFFYSLNLVADAINRILAIPFVREFIAFAAPFVAIAAAFRIVTKLAIFFGKALIGTLAVIPKVVLKYTGLGTVLKKLALDFKAAEGAGKKAIIGIKMAFISTGIGAIIVGVTTLLFAFANAQMNAKMAADALTDSVDKQTGAFTDESIRLVTEAFREDITTKEDWLAIDKYVAMSQEEMAAAVLEGGEAFDTLNQKIHAAREALEEDYKARRISITEYNRGVAALTGLYRSVENQGEVTAASREQIEILQINQNRLNETNRAAQPITNAYSDAVERQAKRLKETSDAQAILKAQTDAVKDAMNQFKSSLDISKAKDDLSNATKDIRKNIKNINMDLSTSQGMRNFRDEFRKASQQVIDDAIAIGGTPAEIEKNIKTGMQKVKSAFIKEAPDKEAAKAAVKDFSNELGLLPDQISKKVKEAADKGKKQAKEDLKPTGGAAADGIIAGVDQKAPFLQAAGARAINNVKAGADKAAEIESPSKVFARMGGFLIEGLSVGIDKNAAKAVKKFTKIIENMTKGGNDKLKEWGEEAKNRFQEFVDDIRMVGDAVSDMRKGFDEALKPPKDFTLSTPLERASQAAAEANTQLAGLQRRLGKDGVLKDKEAVIAGFQSVAASLKENLIAALQEAQAEYDAVKQRFTDFKSSVVNALTGSIDLSAAVQSAKEGGGSITDALNAQAEKAREFGKVVNNLIQGNFSISSIKQVVAAGVGAGTEIGNALLSGGSAAVAADQSIYNELTALGEQIADLAYPIYFKEGEDLAKAQVDGITSLMNQQTEESSPLMRAMKRLARKLGQDVKIKVSLSKSQFDVVINTTRYVKEVSVPSVSQGTTVGRGRVAAGATGAIVNRPTFALIGEAGPEALIPLDQTPGNKPLPKSGIGGDITINVHPSAGMDERELANMVSREISYLMRKGSA